MSDIILYIKMDILCLVLLIIILIKTLSNNRYNKTSRIFALLTFCGILFIPVFSWGNLIDVHLVPTTKFATYIVNMCYLILLNVICMLWFFYSEYIQNSGISTSIKKKILCAIPLFIYIFFVLSAPVNKLLYYVDDDAIYHRGDLFVLQIMVPCMYTLITPVKALIFSWQKDKYVHKVEYQTMALVIWPSIICAAIQLLWQEMTSFSAGILLGIILVYINMQETKISLDQLTRLNNRYQLIQYLSIKMKHRTKGKKLYLLLMDLDYFKTINDQFGHIEGDMALVLLADTLKKYCAGKGHFISRYGGDEFILVCECDNSKEVEAFSKCINEMLKKECENQKKEYKVSISVGYSVYTGQYKNIPDFIKAADHELYKVKKARPPIQKTY